MLANFPFFAFTSPTPPRLQSQSASLPLSKRRFPFGERKNGAIGSGFGKLRFFLLMLVVYKVLPLGLEEAGSWIKTLHSTRINKCFTNIELWALIAVSHRIVDHPYVYLTFLVVFEQSSPEVFVRVLIREIRQQLVLIVEEGMFLGASEVLFKFDFDLFDRRLAKWEMGIAGIGRGEMFGIGTNMQC